VTRRILISLSLALAPALLYGSGISGRRVPSFALPDSNLKYHDVLDYRGKWLLIDVMRTDCPHCQILAPTLERVRQRYVGKVSVLSIVNPPDTQMTVAQYVARHKVTSPIVFDCGQASAALLNVTPKNPKVSVPHLLLVDPQGLIVDDWEYSEATKTIFEGDGLFTILNKRMAGGK
jgi:thiol-disulfide isomerase/thioredoxin